MSRKERMYSNAIFFHNMVQGLNREYIFENDKDKEQYLKFMNYVNKKIDVTIISYCIMSNHAHMLIKTEFAKNLSKFMQNLNTLYGIYYNKKYNRVGYVFRNRFKSQIIYSEKQLYTCINYIHNNPVKAKICKAPNEYKYSSYNEYMKNANKIAKKLNIVQQCNQLQDETMFLEDEEELEEEIKNTINKYLNDKGLKRSELKKDTVHLKEIIKLLKTKYNLSLRRISEYIEVGREKVRMLAKSIDPKR